MRALPHFQVVDDGNGVVQYAVTSRTGLTLGWLELLLLGWLAFLRYSSNDVSCHRVKQIKEHSLSITSPAACPQQLAGCVLSSVGLVYPETTDSAARLACLVESNNERQNAADLEFPPSRESTSYESCRCSAVKPSCPAPPRVASKVHKASAIKHKQDLHTRV